MYAADFPESNNVVDKPQGMTADECEPLNVFQGVDASNQQVVISCWKVTQKELDEIISTGRVWVWHMGRILQPHSVSGINPFEEEASDA